MFHVKRSSPGADGPESVSRETQERLAAYVDLLARWNSRITLVGKRDMDAIWERHIADSLQLVSLLPAGLDRAIDLGSGAGFPGLVLAIASGVPFDLIEADQRKAAFLREAARVTGAPATIHAARIESLSLPPADLVTARALAPLPALFTLARPLLAPGGVCLFPKGESAEEELTAAAPLWQMQVERIPSRTHPHSLILRIKDPRRV